MDLPHIGDKLWFVILRDFPKLFWIKENRSNINQWWDKLKKFLNTLIAQISLIVILVWNKIARYWIQSMNRTICFSLFWGARTSPFQIIYLFFILNRQMEIQDAEDKNIKKSFNFLHFLRFYSNEDFIHFPVIILSFYFSATFFQQNNFLQKVNWIL